MGTQYSCQNKERRRLVGATQDSQGNPIQPKLNGIDYLEVASADQKTLKIYFLHNLPGQTNPVPPAAPPPTGKNVIIEGGARVRDIRIDSISVAGNVLKVKVNEAGDYSTYTLRFINSPTNLDPPAGFDPQLSFVEFTFKVECPNDFDCKQDPVCSPLQIVDPELNYLAKDYSSFRRLILDRLSTLMPDWRERSAADAQIALVEWIAYIGDSLSYFQDAVAAEAYLGTARRRISLRRHARLLDYSVHDGTNSRTWVCIEVKSNSKADGHSVKAKTRLFSRGSSPDVAVEDVTKALKEEPVVFETMHDLVPISAHNSIRFYTWSDLECCLPKGSTKATVIDKGFDLTAGDDLNFQELMSPSTGLPKRLDLKEGDVLVFEELISPTTGLSADADPLQRCAVRLTAVNKLEDPLTGENVMNIEWAKEDALPFPLCLTARIANVGSIPVLKEISVARGNAVLADHGLTIDKDSLFPPVVPDTGVYRAQLRLIDITFQTPYEEEKNKLTPASEIVNQDARRALPAVKLSDFKETWASQRDLLNSDRFAPEFVVEMERDGSAHLRFGNGISAGKKPGAGTQFLATYRVGNGRAGNVGADTIVRIESALKGYRRVRNPIAARGGCDPESMEEVRQFAPQAFRTQQRAVTEADWAEVAERHPEVQKAAATFRWTGSWYTAFITIDRKGGRSVKTDERFKAEVRLFLEQFRIAGYDLEINDPKPVPLEILLKICVAPGYFRSDVKQQLLKVFSRYDLPAGRGFFHPDLFTFGQPVYLSKIYQAAMDVSGVASVEALKFQRWGKLPNKELADGKIVPAALEIIQLDNDPNFPENGRINFEMHGGL